MRILLTYGSADRGVEYVDGIEVTAHREEAAA